MDRNATALEEDSSQELYLLCLDGGGVRGLSSLYILRSLMERLQDPLPDPPPKDAPGPPRPCDYFDMIGGTSTGGLIALMLGRLGMTIDGCIAAYTELIPEIFKKQSHRMSFGGKFQGRYDSKALEDGIKKIVKDQGLDAEALLKAPSLRCKTFVCATKSTSNTVVLSSSASRRRRGGLMDVTKIWQAARATSAATGFFDHVKIDDEWFVDGATGANCPINIMMREATDIWGEGRPDWRPEDNVKCFVSIGTSVPPLKPFKDDLFGITKTMISLSTGTQQTVEGFQREHRRMLAEHRFFRFNVTHGLENIGLDEASKKAELKAATREYCEMETVLTNLESCVRNLKSRERFRKDIIKIQAAAKHLGEEYMALKRSHPFQPNPLPWFFNTRIYDRWVEAQEPHNRFIWYCPPSDLQTDVAALVPKLFGYQQNAKDPPKPATTIYVSCSSFSHSSSLLGGGSHCVGSQVFVHPEDFIWPLISQILAMAIRPDVDPKGKRLNREILSGLNPLQQNILSELAESPRSDNTRYEIMVLVDLVSSCLALPSVMGNLIIILEHVHHMEAESMHSFFRKFQDLLNLFHANKPHGRLDLRLLITGHANPQTKHAINFGLCIDKDTEFKECVSSLDTSHFPRTLVSDAEPGTNQWIRDHQFYSDWQERGGVLWISGKPGSGKSVLAKSLQTILCTSPQHQTVRIVAEWSYSTRGGDESMRHHSMFKTVLHSVLRKCRPIFPSIQQNYQRERKRFVQWEWSIESLVEILQKISALLHNMPKMILVIDGMDESEDGTGMSSRREALSILCSLVEYQQSPFKIILLSRPEPMIEQKLRRCCRISMEHENAHDVNTVIQSRINYLRDIWNKSFDFDDDTSSSESSSRQNITRATLGVSRNKTLSRGMPHSMAHLPEREERELENIGAHLMTQSRGVMLWVNLVIQELALLLKEGSSFLELRQKLQELPSRLDELYQYILLNITRLKHSDGSPNKKGLKIARTILTWIVGASTKQQVRLQELLDVLAIPDETDLPTYLESPEDPLQLARLNIRGNWDWFRRKLYEYCGPFIEVVMETPSNHGTDEESSIYFDTMHTEPSCIVQLLHQTVKDFLESPFATKCLNVPVGSAEKVVESSAMRYLQVAIPTNPSSYAPVACKNELNVKVILDYLDDRYLLPFCLAIMLNLENEVASSYRHVLLSKSPQRKWLFSELLQGEIYSFIHSQYVGPDIYLISACKNGQLTALKNLLGVLSLVPNRWKDLQAAVVSGILLIAVRENLSLSIRPLLELYISWGNYKGLFSILSLVEIAAQAGNTTVINRLFQRVLNELDMASDLSRLNLERVAWIREAEGLVKLDLKTLTRKEGSHDGSRATLRIQKAMCVQHVIDFIATRETKFARLVSRVKWWTEEDFMEVNSESLHRSEAHEPNLGPWEDDWDLISKTVHEEAIKAFKDTGKTNKSDFYFDEIRDCHGQSESQEDVWPYFCVCGWPHTRLLGHMCNNCAPQWPNPLDLPEIPGDDNGHGLFFAHLPLSRIRSLEQQAFEYELGPDIYKDRFGNEMSEFLQSQFLKYPLLCPFLGVAEATAKNNNRYRFLLSEPHNRYSLPVSIWLLEKLLACPLEVHLLAQTFETEFGSIESDRWPSDVLENWYDDGTETDRDLRTIPWSSRLSSQSTFVINA